MPDFQAILDSFNAPPTRHAMMVHWPIVLAFLACAMTLLAAILRSNKTCLWLAIVAQIAFGVAAFITLSSGEGAEDAIKGVMSTAAQETLAEHEEMADKLWWFGAAGTVLLILSAAIKRAGGATCTWLAVVASLAGIGWVSQTAHHGGDLVYKYGVGTPHTQAPPRNAPSTRSDETSRELGASAADGSGGDPVKIAFFRDEAYPILSEYCFNCHNPSKVARDGSGLLDQTSRATLLLGGVSGPAIVPGKPEDSLMIYRLHGGDPDQDIMPPDGKLPDKDIAIIEKWIRDGAVWADPGGMP